MCVLQENWRFVSLFDVFEQDPAPSRCAVKLQTAHGSSTSTTAR